MARTEVDHEQVLVDRIAKGDKQAFRALYEAHEKRVFFFIRRRLGDPHESADVFHEVMLDVWRQADRFEGRSKVSTWIMRIAHNKTIDVLRKRGRRDWDELDEEIWDDAPTAADLLETAGDAAIVRACVEKLKGPMREALTLSFYEEMKYREIAECLSCAEGTIKARVHRAMKAIEACVRRHGLTGAKESPQ